MIDMIELPTEDKYDGPDFDIIYTISSMKQKCSSYAIEHAKEIKEHKNAHMIMAFAILNGMPDIVTALLEQGVKFDKFHMFVAALFNKNYYFSHLEPDDANNLEDAVYESFNFSSVKQACAIYDNYPTVEEINYIVEYMKDYIPLIKKIKSDIDYDGYKERIISYLVPPMIPIESE